MGMDLTYRWSVGAPGRRLGCASRTVERGGDPLFDATLALRRREITGRSLARTLCRYPIVTAQIFAAIYWQALRLRLKGAPFHPHPREDEALLETTS